MVQFNQFRHCMSRIPAEWSRNMPEGSRILTFKQFLQTEVTKLQESLLSQVALQKVKVNYVVLPYGETPPCKIS